MARRTPTGRKFDSVADLATRQHGVVARNQLRRLGWSDDAVDGHAAAGVLHPVFRGVFAVGHRAIGESGMAMAAVLACGRGAVVSHWTAAHLLGLTHRRPTLIDVIAPTDAGRGIDGLRWHRVPAPTPDEIVEVGAIPCTNASRTIVDLAGSRGTRTLRGLIEEAAVLGVLNPAEIDTVLARHRRRGAPLLRSLLRPWRGFSAPPLLRSPLEARFLRELAERGFTRPLANESLALGGRRLEPDFLWPDRRVIVEIDGVRFHGSEPAKVRDRARDRVLAAAGYRVMRVTSRDLDAEPDAVFARLREMLGA